VLKLKGDRKSLRYQKVQDIVFYCYGNLLFQGDFNRVQDYKKVRYTDIQHSTVVTFSNINFNKIALEIYIYII